MRKIPEFIKRRIPKNVKKGTKCGRSECRRDATLMGWFYRDLNLKKKYYEPMCQYHFMQSFFGVWEMNCTKSCRRRAQRRNRAHLDEEDFKTYVPSGLYFAMGKWCMRHQLTVPIHCVHCGRQLRKKKLYTNKKYPCLCGYDSDSITNKAFWDLNEEERESLCMSHGWKHG